MIRKFKATLEKLKKSKDGKTVASNFGYLMLLQIAGYVFPLLTIPYLARVIGVDGFGKIAFAVAVIMLLQTVTDWGFNYTATRDVAQNKDNAEKVSEIFSNVLWAKLFLALLCFIMLLIAIFFIPYFKENQSILLVTFLLVPGNIFYPEWFFQAVERMGFITIFNLVSKALFTMLVFIFIKEKSDFILQPLFISLGCIVVGSFSMYIIIVRWNVKVYRPKWKSVYKTMIGSKDVFITNIMPNFYNNLAVVLLGFWGGSIANGIYDAGRKFIGIAHSFMTVAVRVAFPYLSRKIDKHDLFAKVYLSFSILASLFLFATSSVLIRLFFTEDFYEAEIVLKISSISIFLVGLSRVYGTNYLIIKGYESSLRNITIICSIIGFTISLPLVFYYSYIGASITLVITQTVLGVSIAIKAKSIKRNESILTNENSHD